MELFPNGELRKTMCFRFHSRKVYYFGNVETRERHGASVILCLHMSNQELVHAGIKNYQRDQVFLCSKQSVEQTTKVGTYAILSLLHVKLVSKISLSLKILQTDQMGCVVYHLETITFSIKEGLLAVTRVIC